MTGALRKLLQMALARPWVSPHGFLAVAVVLGLLFAACHVFGWREYAGFLSGNTLTDGQTALGIAYVLAYFGCVVIAPVLALASAIFWLLLGPWRQG
jgi:hypothetical protein